MALDMALAQRHAKGVIGIPIKIAARP